MKEAKSIVLAKSSCLGDHVWNPCTNGKTIQEHLETLSYPASRMFTYGTTIKASAVATIIGSSKMDTGEKPTQSLDLGSMFSSHTFFFNDEASLLFKSTPQDDFESFAADIHNYSEAESIQSAPFGSDAQYWAYQREWQRLLQLFDASRAGCMARGKHHCLGEYLWGDLYTQPLEELIELYNRFESNSIGAKGPGLQTPSPSEFSVLSTPFTEGEPFSFTDENALQKWPQDEGYSDFFHAIHAYGQVQPMRFDFQEKDTNELNVPSFDSPVQGLEASSSSSGSTSSPPPSDNLSRLYHPTFCVRTPEFPSPLVDPLTVDSDEKGSIDGLPAGLALPGTPGSYHQPLAWQQKRREEKKNRSKAYYEMRKYRRSLMIKVLSHFVYTLDVLKGQGCAITDIWQATNRIIVSKRSPQGTLDAYLDWSQDGSSNALKENQRRRRRLHWEKEKDEERNTFQKVRNLAVLLMDILSARPESNGSHQTGIDSDRLGHLTRQKLIATWLSLQPDWTQLSNCEMRLTEKGESKPITALNALFSESKAARADGFDSVKK